MVIVLHRESRTEAKTDSYSNDHIFQKLSMFTENLALWWGSLVSFDEVMRLYLNFHTYNDKSEMVI